MPPEITRVEITEFTYRCDDTGYDEHGFNLVYRPGHRTERSALAVRIETDMDAIGTYVGRSPGITREQSKIFGRYLVGKDPLKRERHWSEIRRALRVTDMIGLGPIDIALWDLAGKLQETSVSRLLGCYRDELPVYVSTPHGDENGGLDSPAAFADFAEYCLDQGVPAFKIHGWGGSDKARDLDREISTVRTVGQRVGDEMDLMLDPACEYETFQDALKVGRACDEYAFYWYEDPYRDGGSSQHAHGLLRERIETPLLLTEYVRGLEPHTDFAANGATDLLRADPDFDGGITGAMKIARMAEGFGMDVEFHAPGPAKRHCMAATRNTNYYELGLLHPQMENVLEPPVYRGGYTDTLDSVTDGGVVTVPDGSGLGVEYDWEYITDHTTQRMRYD